MSRKLFTTIGACRKNLSLEISELSDGDVPAVKNGIIVNRSTLYCHGNSGKVQPKGVEIIPVMLLAHNPMYP